MIKVKIGLLLVLLLILFSLYSNNYIPLQMETPLEDEEIDSQKSSLELFSFVSSAPLFIDGNDGFTPFDGTGSEEDPYLIQNFNITYSGTILIGIFNTDKYFKISNNYLNNTNHAVEGIYLSNVNHGEISNNTIINSRHGIYLDNSKNVIVKNNTLTSFAESGIRLNNSESNFLQSNVISNAVHHGIWLNQSTNNVIAENNISQVYNGIWLKSYSNENTIQNNSIFKTYHGVSVSSSNENNITLNVLKDNAYGIYAGSTGYIWDPTIESVLNRITNNTIFNSTMWGVCLEDGVTDTVLSFNMFLINHVNGTSQAFDNGTNNIFSHNFWDEWTGPDTENSDAIVDDSYMIEGPSNNMDYYPVTDYIHTLNFDFLSRPRIYSPLAGTEINGLVTIQWAPALDADNNPVSYTVFYSNNAGNTWYSVVSNLNILEYQWNTYLVPNDSDFLLKVEANSSIGFTTLDLLDDVVSIQNSDHAVAGLMISSPTWSDTLSGQIIIQWNPAIDTWDHDITYTLHYSDDNGATWNLLADSISATQYTWDTTTVSDGSNYLIKVKGTCSEGMFFEHISEQTFTIKNNPDQTTSVSKSISTDSSASAGPGSESPSESTSGSSTPLLNPNNIFIILLTATVVGSAGAVAGLVFYRRKLKK